MSVADGFCWFDNISDDVLLHILLYVPRTCWKNVKDVCRRFSNICCDKEVFRHSNLACAYGMSERDLQNYLRTGSGYIESLNLNHCHWFSSTILSTCIARCKKIQELYLLDCRLTTKGLSRILCSLDCVKTLLLSVQNLLEFSNEINCNQEVQSSLRNLQHFGLHIREETNGNMLNSLQFHLSQQTTIIEYCPNLESFCVIGQPGSSQRLSKRLIHPLIVKTQNMANLRTMSINSTNDATSRLYFFGVLVKAFETGVPFKNLSVSGLDLKQAVKKSYFIRSLIDSCPTLENLDLSKVHIDELEASITIEDAPCLQYLNLSDIRSESNCLGLMKIASHCPNLVSLNLRGATSGHRHWTEEIISNFDRLLVNCPNLRHVNLTGIHTHNTGFSKSLVNVLASQLKGLRSIALPICSLVQPACPETSSKQPGYVSRGLGKRQRISRQPSPSTSDAPDNDAPNVEGELTLLQKACPEVTSLELINTGFNQSVVMSSTNSLYEPCKPSYQFTSHHLSSVSNWTKLKYLQITGAPGVTQSKALHDIAVNCVCLERLSLAYIGLGTLPPNFWEVLQHFKSLLDLRLEQPHLKLNDRFFQSCLGCDKLQRLLIVSKNSKMEPKVLEAYVEQAHNLYMLQVFTDSTLKDCEKLHSCLQKRYEVERPGFLAVLEPVYHERVSYVVATLPLHHLEEMTILASKVCSRPLHSVSKLL